ncbi:MAG: hypothetical protein OXR66_08790 [Candidatus Woesearchaeota archaeon]|nr:hypothetical protein [Candidatus Woesearchaeota archaeon]
MADFEATPRKWGNSLGIIIPQEVVEQEGLVLGKKVRFIVVNESMERIKNAFGSLHIDTPTEQIMREIDEGWDD